MRLQLRRCECCAREKCCGGASQGLGAIAAKNGFVFGAAAGPVIDKDVAYRELYTTHTQIVTTDIAMKMGTIVPQPGPKRFESADRMLQFCVGHRIPMRGHCLIWNDWVPQWVRSMSVPERQAFFEGYIEEVAGRYAENCIHGMSSMSRSGRATRPPAVTGSGPGTMRSEPVTCAAPSSG